MCGICGITKNDEKTLDQLNAKLVHRGPDGSNKYFNKCISLGHSRLAIIDLSDRASQPMHSQDGRYVVSYNGELYNYRELREELSGQYTFKTNSDTEVFLAAYAIWGKGMFSKLKGIFAFAIWDNQEEALFLGRDQMGVKPLYYSFDDGMLTFSSELSALQSTVRGSLDKQRLALYFALNYIPAGESIIVGINKLPAGHYLEYQSGTIKITEYFDVFLGDKTKPETNDIYKTIDGAVSRQLISDRPVGVFLSGGIDSSVVLHHASKHQKQVKTFSVEFEMISGAESEADKFNADARLAERTATHYEADHKTFSISIDDIRNNLETAIQSLDEPIANPTTISQYLLSKWVREDGVVVALGGDGGDELFGGYTRHRAMMAAHYYGFVPQPFQNFLSHVHPTFGKLQTRPGLPLHVALMINKQKDIDRISKIKFNSTEATTAEFEKYYEQAPEELHVLDQFMRIDRRTWLAEESLTRSDRSSMAHGLELRVPLLDIDVVRLSDSISPFKKTTPWTGKKILRQTYRRHLPEYLYDQPKRGWISPGAKWFRDPVINKFCREVFSSSYYDGLDSFIDWSEVQIMFQKHVDKQGYYLQPLWNILVLQIWARKQKLTFSGK